MELETLPPSAFARMGNPSCSRWGKSEIEWLALAYVQALANDGDTWKRLTREQTYTLLSDEQKQGVHGMLTGSFDLYERWFESVADQIVDSAGAWGVGGFWNEYRYQKTLAHSASQHIEEK